MRIVQSLTAIVQGQPLGSRSLEYQRSMITKLNLRNKIVGVITLVFRLQFEKANEKPNIAYF